MSPNLSLLNRVRSEFIEMPGLRLRIDQAQRLWNLAGRCGERVASPSRRSSSAARYDLYAGCNHHCGSPPALAMASRSF